MLKPHMAVNKEAQVPTNWNNDFTLQLHQAEVIDYAVNITIYEPTRAL